MTQWQKTAGIIDIPCHLGLKRLGGGGQWTAGNSDSSDDTAKETKCYMIRTEIEIRRREHSVQSARCKSVNGSYSSPTKKHARRCCSSARSEPCALGSRSTWMLSIGSHVLTLVLIWVTGELESIHTNDCIYLLAHSLMYCITFLLCTNLTSRFL